MTKLLKESEVSLSTLADVLDEAGWTVELEESRCVMSTDRGIGFGIAMDTERKFLRLGTYLPLHENLQDRVELVTKLNDCVFLPTFSLDKDDDLTINYVMSYEKGLITSQFVRIINRFASMLDYVVNEFNEGDATFNFDRGTSVRPSNEASETLQ